LRRNNLKKASAKKPSDDLRPEYDLSQLKKEIRDTNYFLALLSCNATEGEGYQYVELDEALERLKRFPTNQVFLIPARLNECES
jgi:hypothetical protein